MRFDLKQPCADCPFRKDCIRGWLGQVRAEEITDALLAAPGKTFACHKTTSFSEEGEHEQHSDEQHCAGALLLVEAVGFPNQMLQLAERLGARDPQRLDADAARLVFEDRESFIAHHCADVKPTRGRSKAPVRKPADQASKSSA